MQTGAAAHGRWGRPTARTASAQRSTMSEFDYDAFTQQLKVKLAEDKTPKPSRTLHLEFVGDPFDPLTAVNIRHIRAAVRAYAAERAAAEAEAKPDRSLNLNPPVFGPGLF